MPLYWSFCFLKWPSGTFPHLQKMELSLINILSFSSISPFYFRVRYLLPLEMVVPFDMNGGYNKILQFQPRCWVERKVHQHWNNPFLLSTSDVKDLDYALGYNSLKEVLTLFSKHLAFFCLWCNFWKISPASYLKNLGGIGWLNEHG